MSGRKEYPRLLTLAVAVFLAASFLFTCLIERGGAQGAYPTIFLSPLTSTAQPGESFNVSMWIVNGIILWTYEMHISYSPQVLEVVRVRAGDYLERGMYQTFWTYRYNNTIGDFYATESLLNPAPEASGDGELFTITFKVKSPAKCLIHIYNSMLVSSGVQPIPHDRQDGVFSSTPNILTQDMIFENYTFPVQADSDSTLSQIEFDQPAKLLRFNVTGPDGTNGSTVIFIPKMLLDAPGGGWAILIDLVPLTSAFGGNSSHTFICMNYNHSTHEIQIRGTEAIPEFAPTIPLPIVILVAATFIAFAKKRISKKRVPSPFH